MLRISYARTMESPFNENLVLSNNGCANIVLNPLLGCTVPGVTPFEPWLAKRIPRGSATGVRKICCFLWRVHLEVHA